MSTVPTYLEPPAQARPWNTNGRAVVSRRALVAAAALSALLAFALSQSLTGTRSQALPAVRADHGFSREGLLSLPLAAQGPVSATLGAYAPLYRMIASQGGFAAVNPAQRLDARYDRAGVSVSAGATRVGLSLRAVGYGASLRALAPATPGAKANRVVYARRGVSEWYANGPLGVEQGFTVARAPAGSAAAPLTLAMALSGDARAALAAGGRSIAFSHAGAPCCATAACAPPTPPDTCCAAGWRCRADACCCASMRAARATR